MNLIKGRLSRYAFLIGLGTSLLNGCKEIKTEISDVLHEDATVVDVVYTPSNHGSGAGPAVGMVSNGDISVGVAFTSVDIPEKYAVVFKCKHGKFIVEGTDKEHKELWERLQEGQEVDITYKERYHATYDDLNKDGKQDLVERILFDYDFLDAQYKKKK